MGLTIPQNLAGSARQHDDLREWIASDLPAAVAAAAQRWSLHLGEPFLPGGQCAWVAPVTGAGQVLKVAFAHDESADEAAALRLWDGEGTARLYASHQSASTVTLLLERCSPGTPLGDALPEQAQDLVVRDLLHRLWARPYAPGTFRPLARMCTEWVRQFEQRYDTVPAAERIDPGLAAEGVRLFRSLPGSAEASVLLCTDLHAANILSARREPWLVIDPKPYVGDPAYDVLQHMLNCEGRLVRDPAALADRMASLTGLDSSRVRLWLFARAVIESPTWPLMRQVATRIAP